MLGLYTFQTSRGATVEWNLMMAAALVTRFPIILLFFITQRYFIEGIALTGLKGPSRKRISPFVGHFTPGRA